MVKDFGMFKLPSGNLVRITGYGKEDRVRVADQGGQRDVVRCVYEDKVENVRGSGSQLIVLQEWFDKYAVAL